MLLCKKMIHSILPKSTILEAYNGKMALEILENQNVNLILIFYFMYIIVYFYLNYYYLILFHYLVL